MPKVLVFGFVIALFGLGFVGADEARAACVIPNQLTNGQTADASQVMTNFNAVAACANTELR